MTHRYGDERIAEWLEENGYHPRSPAHGSASCMYFLDDFLHESDAFAEAARNGEIVYQEDYTVGQGPSRWNTDLVVGPPADDVEFQTELADERAIQEGEPAEVWLAIDAKSVMTEHGKARRNRQRDINSFADIMHRHHPGAVTGGILLINMAERFKSPLRDEDDVTEHDRIERLVEETVDIFRDIDRADGEISPNVDGVGCIVVDHTNMDDGHETLLVTEPPAPQPGEIVHYEDFLHIMIDTLEGRFLKGEPPDLDQRFAAERLGEELRRRVVELTHRAYVVDQDLEDGSVDAENIEALRRAVSSVSGTVDEVENEFG